MVIKRILSLFVVSALFLAALWLVAEHTPAPNSPPALTLANSADLSGFAHAAGPREFQFPQHHGPHFDYQTEWWYYTGNVEAENGDHFGYQLTFFRRGLTPGAPARSSDFAANQIYFAHFAVTDAAGNRHTFAERFSRGGRGWPARAASRSKCGWRIGSRSRSTKMEASFTCKRTTARWRLILPCAQ